MRIFAVIFLAMQDCVSNSKAIINSSITNPLWKVISVFFILTFVFSAGSLFVQLKNGALFKDDLWQLTEYGGKGLAENYSLRAKLEKILNTKSEYLETKDRFTLADSPKKLVNLLPVFLILISFIYLLPIVIFKMNLHQRDLVISFFASLAMGFLNFQFSSFNWFFSTNSSGGPGFFFVILFWTLIAIPLCIEYIIIAYLIQRKNRLLRAK